MMPTLVPWIPPPATCDREQATSVGSLLLAPRDAKRNEAPVLLALSLARAAAAGYWRAATAGRRCVAKNARLVGGVALRRTCSWRRRVRLVLLLIATAWIARWR